MLVRPLLSGLIRYMGHAMRVACGRPAAGERWALRRRGGRMPANGWGTPAVLGGVAVTVLFWAGIAVLVGPVYRRVVRQGAAAESAEIAKLPGLAARYGLSYVEHDDQLPQALARHAPTRAAPITCCLVASAGGRWPSAAGRRFRPSHDECSRDNRRFLRTR